MSADNNQPAPPPAFVGWRRHDNSRRSTRWQAVAFGQTEAETSAKLFDLMAKERGGSWSTVILPVGEEP